MSRILRVVGGCFIVSNQLVGFEEGKEIFILLFEYYMTTFIIYHLMTYCEMFTCCGRIWRGKFLRPEL